VSTIQAWESVRQRWQPDSHVWDGVESIPIETARNEVLDLCDGIDAMRQRAEAAEAECNRLRAQITEPVKESDDLELVELRKDANEVLESLDKNQIAGAINWADLRCVQTNRARDAYGRTWYRVEIEEAAPGEESLIAAVRDGLAHLGWYVDDIEIETAW
jgi:hypothetical protein